MSLRALVGRELWRIGDWGGASSHIGRRWEAIGSIALSALIGKPGLSRPDFIPFAAASFVNDSGCEQALQAAGLSHADAVLVGMLDGQLALQPVDFKWSLEVAEPGQVAAETLQALLAADLAPVRLLLEVQLSPVSDQPPGAGSFALDFGALVLLDGFFLAPDHAANHAFLGSQANQHRAEPLESGQVSFAAVEGIDFFSPLPGWQVGETLAAQEGARRALGTLEGAERYYRLGAGVLGALTNARRSIFDPTVPAIDPLAELASLRRAHRISTTEQLIAYLDRVVSARSERVKALGQLGRTIYPQASFQATLKRFGITLAERSDASRDARRWYRLYGQVQRELSRRLSAEGRALVTAGQNDGQALASLTARAGEYGRLATALAERLVAAQVSVGSSEALAP